MRFAYDSTAATRATLELRRFLSERLSQTARGD